MTDGGTTEAQTESTSAPAGGAGPGPAGISAAFQGNASPGQASPGQTELSAEQDHARYRTLRDKLQAELSARTERIANDPELDEHARSWKLNSLFDSALTADTKISELYERELEDNIAQEEKKVYRVPKNLMDSTRSAYQQVRNELDYVSVTLGEDDLESIQASREKLEEMYERGERTGDKALMLAVYHRATELGIDYLRDKHLETSPELAKAWEGYNLARQKLADWTSKEENLVQRLDGRRGIVKPPEIG